MTFDANIQAIAQTELLPKAVDIVHNGNVLTMRLLGNTKPWRGTKLEQPIVTTEAGNGGSFSGLDRFSTNAVNTKQKLSFDVRAYEQPVVIPQLEADVVANSTRALELTAGAIEEAANEMADNIGDLFYSDGTGNSSKDFLGLAAIVDDGGEVATYGGLARSTYSGLQSTETDVGGALTLAVMATSFDAAKIGSDAPTLIVTTPAIWSDFEALHQATINTNVDGYRKVTASRDMVPMSALAGEMGFDALYYRGVPVVADEKCSSGNMWFLNEKHLAFYRLKSTAEGYSDVTVGGNNQLMGEYDMQINPNVGFDWSGFMNPVDQYGKVGHILLIGNLVSFDPRKHAVLNTIS